MDNKAKILDIAMNLNRIGNWAADDYRGKKKRITLFLDQNNSYLSSLEVIDGKFKKTLALFKKKYKKLEKEGKTGPKDPLFWAEMMMTWGNILTHRASFL